MNDLSGKTAVVTGGGRDIGRAMSVALAAAGARVVVNYLGSEPDARATASAIEQAGGTAVLCRADVTAAAGVSTLRETTAAAFRDRLDILVNNAGGLVGRKRLDEMDDAFVDRVMALNFGSTVAVTRALLPLMGQGGSIVNMASLAGRNGGAPGATIYAAAKAAVMTFTRGLAKELGPRGIRVNCLCPGLIDTTFHDTFSTDAERDRAHQMTPLGREGRAEEVAAATAFLAGDGASFMTGVSLDVNGGMGFS